MSIFERSKYTRLPGLLLWTMLKFLFPHKVTPLHYAAAEGHVDAQQYLVEAGADFHSKDDDGVSE